MDKSTLRNEFDQDRTISKQHVVEFERKKKAHFSGMTGTIQRFCFLISPSLSQTESIRDIKQETNTDDDENTESYVEKKPDTVNGITKYGCFNGKFDDYEKKTDRKPNIKRNIVKQDTKKGDSRKYAKTGKLDLCFKPQSTVIASSNPIYHKLENIAQLDVAHFLPSWQSISVIKRENHSSSCYERETPFRFSLLQESSKISSQIPTRESSKIQETSQANSRIPVRTKGYVWRTSEKENAAIDLVKPALRSRIPIRIKSKTIATAIHLLPQRSEQFIGNIRIDMRQNARIPLRIDGYACNPTNRKKEDAWKTQNEVRRMFAAVSKIHVAKETINKDVLTKLPLSKSQCRIIDAFADIQKLNGEYISQHSIDTGIGNPPPTPINNSIFGIISPPIFSEFGCRETAAIILNAPKSELPLEEECESTSPVIYSRPVSTINIQSFNNISSRPRMRNGVIDIYSHSKAAESNHPVPVIDRGTRTSYSYRRPEAAASSRCNRLQSMASGQGTLYSYSHPESAVSSRCVPLPPVTSKQKSYSYSYSEAVVSSRFTPPPPIASGQGTSYSYRRPESAVSCRFTTLPPITRGYERSEVDNHSISIASKLTVLPIIKSKNGRSKVDQKTMVTRNQFSTCSPSLPPISRREK